MVGLEIDEKDILCRASPGDIESVMNLSVPEEG